MRPKRTVSDAADRGRGLRPRSDCTLPRRPRRIPRADLCRPSRPAGQAAGTPRQGRVNWSRGLSPWASHGCSAGVAPPACCRGGREPRATPTLIDRVAEEGGPTPSAASRLARPAPSLGQTRGPAPRTPLRVPDPGHRLHILHKLTERSTKRARHCQVDHTIDAVPLLQPILRTVAERPAPAEWRVGNSQCRPA